MVFATISVLQLGELSLSFKYPRDVINVILSIEAFAIEFGNRERRDFVIISPWGMFFTDSSGFIYALRGMTIVSMIFS